MPLLSRRYQGPAPDWVFASPFITAWRYFPLVAFGSDEQKKRWVPPLAKGEKIGAFCLTEPNIGSDASGVESTAVRDGDHYIVNANKVLITNGGVADTCLIFVKTDRSAGARGLSVIVVERGTPGFEVGDLENLFR